MSNSTRPEVNRLLVGGLSILCLGAGIAVGMTYSMDNLWCGSFVRVGVLLAAFWIALPKKGGAAAWANISPWWIVAIVVGLILIRRTQIFVAFGAVLFFLAVIVPLLIGTSKRG